MTGGRVNLAVHAHPVLAVCMFGVAILAARIICDASNRQAASKSLVRQWTYLQRRPVLSHRILPTTIRCGLRMGPSLVRWPRRAGEHSRCIALWLPPLAIEATPPNRRIGQSASDSISERQQTHCAILRCVWRLRFFAANLGRSRRGTQSGSLSSATIAREPCQTQMSTNARGSSASR